MIISNLLKRYVSWIYMFQLALQSQDQLISMFSTKNNKNFLFEKVEC